MTSKFESCYVWQFTFRNKNNDFEILSHVMCDELLFFNQNNDVEILNHIKCDKLFFNQNIDFENLNHICFTIHELFCWLCVLSWKKNNWNISKKRIQVRRQNHFKLVFCLNFVTLIRFQYSITLDWIKNMRFLTFLIAVKSGYDFFILYIN